jgi:hypothetical protein
MLKIDQVNDSTHRDTVRALSRVASLPGHLSVPFGLRSVPKSISIDCLSEINLIRTMNRALDTSDRLSGLV